MTSSAPSSTGFLSALSHELRTPLTGMIGFSELLHRGDVGPLSNDQKEVVDDILASARHLLELIDGAIELGRLEAGTLAIRPEPVDLAARLPALCESARALARQKDVALSVEVEAGLEPVMVDPGLLQRLLYQCVSDALKATEPGRSLTVRAAAGDPAHFRIGVDPFPHRPQSPSGLGVALVTSLVRAQGGEAGFRVEEGRDEAFVLALPRRTPPRLPVGT